MYRDLDKNRQLVLVSAVAGRDDERVLAGWTESAEIRMKRPIVAGSWTMPILWVRGMSWLPLDQGYLGLDTEVMEQDRWKGFRPRRRG